MAARTTPHTNSEQNANSAVMEAESNQNPRDLGPGEDAALYKYADGAQTGGTRAFHVTDQHQNQPRSTEDGSSLIASNRSPLPQDGQQGVTNHPEEERERQRKVIDENR